MRRALLPLACLAAAVSPAAAQDNPDSGMIPVPLYTNQTAPQDVDPLRQFAADMNARFIYGAQSRKTISDSVAALAAGALTVEGRVTAIEAKPDLTPRVVQLEARPNYTTATLAATGVIKANIAQIARTTSPVGITLPSISVLSLSLPPSMSVSMSGVQLGDFVQVTFATTPPAGVTITGQQVTAAGTVLVTFQATQALTLAASTQSLNFAGTR